MKMTIAVGFDGTCVVADRLGGLIDVPHAVTVLHALHDRGIGIILYTNRTGEELADARRWFRNIDLPLYGVNRNPDYPDAGRVAANLYIDSANLGAPLTSDVNKSDMMFVNWLIVHKIIFQAADLHHHFFLNFLN